MPATKLVLPADTLLDPRLQVGANNPPPEPSPFDIATKAINDIFEEVTLWLDGHPIDSQELADGVSNLLVEIRKAEKLADDARKAEKEPHDKAITEIQGRYAPLIADTKAVKGKTVLAAEACKAALQPWLDAKSRQLDEEARLAREEADRQRQEAHEALQASDATNLAEREAAEALLRDARKAETVANAASRRTAIAGGSMGRASGLRTVWVTTVSDPILAARTCWAEAREEMLAFLREWGERQVRTGRREIPGFTITEEKRVV